MARHCTECHSTAQLCTAHGTHPALSPSACALKKTRRPVCALYHPHAAPAGEAFGSQACLFALGTKLGTLAFWRCEVTHPAHLTTSTTTINGPRASSARPAADAGATATAGADPAPARANGEPAAAAATATAAAGGRATLEQHAKQQHAERFTYLGMLQVGAAALESFPLVGGKKKQERGVSKTLQLGVRKHQRDCEH
eukprot:663547-Pelagomonas_calceolata.AAC.2